MTNPVNVRGQRTRFARARLRGLIGEADMTAVLALAGDVFTDPTVIYGSTR